MSIGSFGFAGIGPGTILAQPAGDTDRAQHDSGAQQSQIHSDLKAEQAAGIGQTDGEDHETEDRDADGRRPWELPPKKKAAAPTEAAIDEQPHSKDPSGQRGNALDLTG
jgi:hypothetical protein